MDMYSCNVGRMK